MGNMSDVSRRSFMGIMGATALSSVLSGVALADETASEEPKNVDEVPVVWTGEYLMSNEAADAEAAAALGPITEDPARFTARGGTTLTLEELNRIRRERVDAAEGYDREDGVHVDAIWHKLAVLTSTYGTGGADPTSVNVAEYLKYLFADDEQAAQDYLQMPMGKVFTPYEYAEVSGKTVEECKAICESLSVKGLLYHARYGAGDDRYHQLPYVHGFFEQSVKDFWDQDLVDVTLGGYFVNPTLPDLTEAGTPLYYAIPCSEEIVSDERVLPLNDWREVVERYDKFALCPCCCSMIMNGAYTGVADIPEFGTPEFSEFRNSELFDDHQYRVERCLALGEQAEYYIESGNGREISKEECIAVLERNIDEGLVLQAGYVRNTDIICSCHSNCCGVLNSYFAEGPEAWAKSPIVHNASNYLLQYDRDACIQCGACAQRCPMYAISMDSGYPEVTGFCVRCGQCGMVCPAHARTLTARPANDRLPVPDDHMDDHNRKFGYRLEHGLQ